MMKLVGTLICYGSAFAIYSERQPPEETITQWTKTLYERENLFIGPEYKLLLIADEAAAHRNRPGPQ
jgi:hypothetical protein